MILHLTRDYPPRRSGGLSTAVETTVHGLETSGVASRVISFDGWGRKGKRANDTLPRPATTDAVYRVRDRTDADRAAAWLASRPVDVVHVHDAMLWPFVNELGISANVPRVHTLHVVSHHQDRLRGLDRKTKTTQTQAQALGEASALIAPTPAVAHLVAVDFPEVVERLRVARLGVALSPPPTGKRRGLLFVGRYTDMAGIADLVDVVGALSTATPLTIAGGLPDNPRAEARWSTALNDAAKAAGRDVRETGWLTHKQLAERRGSASILIAPNRYATFGLAVAEAMAASIAVCAYRVGGFVDLISDRQTGRLCEPTPHAIADAVSELDGDDETTSALGAAARSSIERDYNVEIATAELLAIYAELH